jgi:hypothetical protein
MKRLSSPRHEIREVAANRKRIAFAKNKRAGDAQPQLSLKKGGEEEIIRRHGFL